MPPAARTSAPTSRRRGGGRAGASRRSGAAGLGPAALVLLVVVLGGVLAGRAGDETPAHGYDALFVEAARSTPGTSAAVLAAQADVESGFDPDAVSPKGAQGILQFTPATWADHGVDGDGDGVADPFDPADAIPAAARYREALRERLADVPGDPDDLVLAGYNAGPGAVLEHGGVPPFAETREYVERVRDRLDRYGYLDAEPPTTP